MKDVGLLIRSNGARAYPHELSGAERPARP